LIPMEALSMRSDSEAQEGPDKGPLDMLPAVVIWGWQQKETVHGKVFKYYTSSMSPWTAQFSLRDSERGAS
jgi:hypothetical protein